MSLFRQFINLRDDISNHLNNNIDALNAITNNEGAGLTADTFPVSRNRTLKISNELLALYDHNNVQVSELTFSDVSDLNVFISNTDEKWSDLIDELSVGASSYQLMGDLVAKYSYANRVSFSDITNYIRTYDLNDEHVIVDSLFTATDDEGYISRNSFIDVLNQWISSGKEATDRDSYDVDTTNPYGLSSVTSIMITAVSTAVSTVCVVLGGIFGGFLSALGVIISLLHSMIDAVQDFSTVRINNDSSNLYVKGPISAISMTQDYTYLPSRGSHIWLSESNGVGLFTWPVNFNDRSQGMRCNAYYYPCWDAYEVIKYLIGHGNITADTQNEQIKFSNISFIAGLWQNPYTQFLKYGNVQLTDVNEVSASLAIGFVIQAITGWWTIHPDNAVTFKWTYGSQSISPYAGKVVQKVCQVLKTTIDMGTSALAKDEWLVHHASAFKIAMNELANHIQYNIFPYRDKINGYASVSGTVADTMTNSGGLFPRLDAPIVGNPAGTTILDGTNDTVIIRLGNDVSSYDTLITADVLPTDWGITLPQYDAISMDHTLWNIAIGATIVALAGTTLKRAITKRNISKAALRANEVNKARDAYLADPTNVALRKDFENKAFKYNKLGKWFGWGTYDAANGWVDSASASDYGPTLDNTASFSDNQALLKAIKSLIR